jgi:PAS domain S-box-containing protein
MSAEEQNWFRVLFEQSNDAIIIHRQGHIEEVNGRATELLGFSREELVGMALATIFAPEQAAAGAAAQKTVQEQGSIRFETRLRRKDGAHVDVEVSSRVVAPETGTVQGVVRDITQRLQGETERREFEARLRASQRMESLGTLARGMAHEINNPLNVILNYAEIIGDGLGADAARQGDLQELKNAAERIRKVVQAMLRFSEPDSVHMTPTRLDVPVEQVADLLRAELDSQGIDLVIDIPPDLPQIRVRRRQIEQVLISLVQNAMEAMIDAPEHRITLAGQVVERGGLHWVRLSVKDDGAGIPASDLERVFDPFFTTRSRHRHAGLGLTVALGTVRAHQGELTIDSTEGAGTTVHVDLPAWEKQRQP